MTLLDDIIDAASDSRTATADLLRKVQVLGRRVGAQDLVAWVKSELGGYAETDDLPLHRVLETNVVGLFMGPMRSQIREPLTIRPDGLEDQWTISLRQPLAELQALASVPGDDDPRRPWSHYAVDRYAKSGLFSIEFHTLFSVHNVITRQSLLGVVDSIRSKALDFALDVQERFPQAGELGGPTVTSQPELARITNNFTITNNITGDGTNVAAGNDISQASTVRPGDRDSFEQALAAAGLSSEDATEFVDAVQGERSIEGERSQTFLDRVRSGTVAVASGVARDVAADILKRLAQAFLGGG